MPESESNEGNGTGWFASHYHMLIQATVIVLIIGFEIWIEFVRTAPPDDNTFEYIKLLNTRFIYLLIFLSLFFATSIFSSFKTERKLKEIDRLVNIDRKQSDEIIKTIKDTSYKGALAQLKQDDPRYFFADMVIKTMVDHCDTLVEKKNVKTRSPYEMFWILTELAKSSNESIIGVTSVGNEEWGKPLEQYYQANLNAMHNRNVEIKRYFLIGDEEEKKQEAIEIMTKQVNDGMKVWYAKLADLRGGKIHLQYCEFGLYDSSVLCYRRGKSWDNIDMTATWNLDEMHEVNIIPQLAELEGGIVQEFYPDTSPAIIYQDV